MAASDDTDTRWPYSNYGSCVDLYAPGVDIVSAYYTSTTATLKASGTSMACPLVSGAVAQYLQLDPTAGPTQVLPEAEMSTRAICTTVHKHAWAACMCPPTTPAARPR